VTAALITRAAVSTEVRFAERVIDALAVPYDTPAACDDSYGVYVERIARGAFAGAERRAERVKVLRDHDVTRAVGKALSLDTRSERGLLTRLRIARTPLGDETLALADDGVLDLSICARPLEGCDEWNSDASEVVRRSLWLEDLSLVPLPAYDDARVLAVRAQAVEQPPQGTPNLDAVRAWRIAQRFGLDSTPADQ
jgi:HK97 family phage prohead protease